MSYRSGSSVRSQVRPRAVSQPSIDQSYLCEDLTQDLEEATLQPVGGGSFSDVYKYKDRHADPPQFFAVKQFRYHSSYGLSEDQTERRIRKEIQSWCRLKHSNILRMEGILFRRGSHFPCLVSQWMYTGTSREYCEKQTSDVDIIKFASGISDGLSYMHQKRIAHGDIRGDNILVSESGHALICDFGLSKIVASGDTASSTVGHGAIRYRGPEFFAIPRIMPDKPTFAGDVWMFAMTFLELWSGLIPYHSKTDTEVVMMLHNRQKPDFSHIEAMRDSFKAAKERVLSICGLCWVMDPANRPAMNTVAAMMRVLATEDAQQMYTLEEEEVEVGNDSDIDLSESLTRLSVVDSPELVPRRPNHSGGEGENRDPAPEPQVDEDVPPLTSSPVDEQPSASSSSGPTPLSSPPSSPGVLSATSSGWAEFPVPPPPTAEGILQGPLMNARAILYQYGAKRMVPVSFISEPSGADHAPGWFAKCIIGPEEQGTGYSFQKKAAEEQAAKSAIQKLNAIDPLILAQCFQYLPTLQAHLRAKGLANRIQIHAPKLDAVSHPFVFICEITRDGVNVCEGRAPKKDESQETAARHLAEIWREAVLQES